MRNTDYQAPPTPSESNQEGGLCNRCLHKPSGGFCCRLKFRQPWFSLGHGQERCQSGFKTHFKGLAAEIDQIGDLFGLGVGGDEKEVSRMTLKCASTMEST